MNAEKIVRESYWVLKLTYGIVPIVAGLDKFTNLLVDWSTYLSPAALAALPFSAQTFMMIVGIIEIAAGALVLSRFTTLGAWIVSAWLLGIALNLVIGGYFDIAVRDVVLAIGAFRLARVSQVVASSQQQGTARSHKANVPAHA